MIQHEEVRVLIVEDDFMVRQMIRSRVEDVGYTIAGEALDGQQAVEMAQSLAPNVILMDIKMPDMDGIEATRQIYEACPTPVVMLTAYDNPELVQQASEVGAGAYLVKLPATREIERAITIAMARFSDMMELRWLNTELQARNEQLQARNKQLQSALDKVKLLGGLLPICGNCKKIRDDEGYWQEVEVYIRDHSEAKFSHGICPNCMQELYPEIHQKLDERKRKILDVLAELGWANVEDISTAANLSESDIINSLLIMAKGGQVRVLDVDGIDFYNLL